TIDRPAAFDAATTRVDADGAVAHVVVADHEHVGDLLELGPPDASADGLVGLGDVDAVAAGTQTAGNRGGAGVVVVANRQHPRLDRRQPSREGARVVLDEDAEEAL